MKIIPFFTVLLLLLAPAVTQAEPPLADRLAASAAKEIGVTVHYDPAYRVIAYPGGDVPMDRGVCSDVIIRAYRGAGIDLQRLVNQDMHRDFKAYPHLWGLSHPDANIDHRRVPNLAVFFTRHGQSLPVTRNPDDYHTGDIVTWMVLGNLPHIGMVSADRSNGRPLMIHNIGRGAQEEDMLFAYPITGHYRYLPGAHS